VERDKKKSKNLFFCSYPPAFLVDFSSLMAWWAAGVLVLLPKAGIRIIQYSAGAGSSGGNRIRSNRRQQQQFERHFNGNSLEFGCVKEAGQSIPTGQAGEAVSIDN
jgi:hypothetical protein